MNQGFVRKVKYGVPFYACDALDDTGLVAHGFSTRHGGVSGGVFGSLNLGRSIESEKENIIQNRERFSAALGVSSKDARFARQEHGDNIFIVSDYSDLVPDGEGYDGFITNLKNVPLMVFMADCLPLIMLDPEKHVVAAIHCGWRGTAKGIAGKAFRLMAERFDSNPQDIIAAIGPCIMPCHFITGDDVPKAMLERFGEAIAPHIKTAGDKFSVDISEINAYALEREGVKRSSIHILGLCTACDTDEFFSHRIMGFDRGVCAGLVSLI